MNNASFTQLMVNESQKHNSEYSKGTSTNTNNIKKRRTIKKNCSNYPKL